MNFFWGIFYGKELAKENFCIFAVQKKDKIAIINQ